MGLWSRLRAVLAPSYGVAPHLLALRATLIDLRRAVAITEAVEASRLARGRALQGDLKRWERRLRGEADAELRARVGAVVGRLRAELAAVRAGLAETQEALRRGEGQLLECGSRLVVLRQREAAYGRDVSGLDLDIDEASIRAEAAAALVVITADEPEDPDLAFLTELYERREANRPGLH